MIRKQIYLKERQQEAIRSIANARGISEAEVIREAIDTRRGQQVHGHPLDPSAWKRAVKLMRSLQPKKTSPKSSLPAKWNRAQLYEDLLNRHGRSTR